MSPKSPPTLVAKANALLRRDPKKSALMAGLAVVMLSLWARMLFTGPASATASFIRRSVSVMTDSGQVLPRPASSNPVMDWLAESKRPIERNLFAIRLDFYARSPAHGSGVVSPEDPAKSPTDEADQDREKQIVLENLQTQVGKLKLQTTVMGDVPRALINGELVKQGDTVEGFTVGKIEPRKVALEQDGVTLEIVMP